MRVLVVVKVEKKKKKSSEWPGIVHVIGTLWSCGTRAGYLVWMWWQKLVEEEKRIVFNALFLTCVLTMQVLPQYQARPPNRLQSRLSRQLRPRPRQPLLLVRL